MSKKYYYLDAANEVLGPFTLVELDALHKSGKITEFTEICEEGKDNWMSFYEIPRPAAPKQKLPEAAESPKASQAKQVTERKPPEYQGITKDQGSALIAILLVAIGAPFWVFLKPVPQWEYEVVSASYDTFLAEMNKHCSKGWELVTSRPVADGFEGIVKRPKR